MQLLKLTLQFNRLGGYLIWNWAMGFSLSNAPDLRTYPDFIKSIAKISPQTVKSIIIGSAGRRNLALATGPLNTAKYKTRIQSDILIGFFLYFHSGISISKDIRKRKSFSKNKMPLCLT